MSIRRAAPMLAVAVLLAGCGDHGGGAASSAAAPTAASVSPAGESTGASATPSESAESAAARAAVRAAADRVAEQETARIYGEVGTPDGELQVAGDVRWAPGRSRSSSSTRRVTARRHASPR